MSRYVVYESHTINDDKCEMPDMNDFQAMENKIVLLEKRLEESCNQLATRTELTSLSNKVQKLKGTPKVLEEILEKGKWKELLRKNLSEVLALMEQRHKEFNQEFDFQLQQISALSTIETHIDNKIVDMQLELCEVIRTEIANELDALRQRQEALETLLSSSPMNQSSGRDNNLTDALKHFEKIVKTELTQRDKRRKEELDALRLRLEKKESPYIPPLSPPLPAENNSTFVGEILLYIKEKIQNGIHKLTNFVTQLLNH